MSEIPTWQLVAAQVLAFVMGFAACAFWTRGAVARERKAWQAYVASFNEMLGLKGREQMKANYDEMRADYVAQKERVREWLKEGRSNP